MGFWEEEEFELVFNDEAGDRGDFCRETEESGESGDVRPTAIPAMSLEDGYAIMRNEYGYIDLEYWSQLCGRSAEEIIEKAEGWLIFRDPAQVELGADRTIGWLTSEELLKGNRIRKLQEARRIQARCGQLEATVAYLEKNLPDAAEGADIHVSLGATWILDIPDFLGRFLSQLLELDEIPAIKHDAYSGKSWCEYKRKPNYVLNNYTYGTLRMSCIQIFEHEMNAIPVKVYDPVYNWEKDRTDYILNKPATLEAQEKAAALEQAFSDYCHKDKENERLLEEAYISHFGYGICTYKGDYLTMEDADPGFQWYDYQKKAVARIRDCRNVLLAGQVGSGKTCEYSGGIHELIRLGICKKAVVAVPNSTLDAAAEAYRQLYPRDPVLVCHPKKEFAIDRRKQTLDQIKKMESGIVFMAYSSFDMISMSRTYMFAKKDAEVRTLQILMAGERDYWRKRSLENALKRLQKSVKEFKENFEETVTTCYDLLGFDILVVDEAHNYKNISLNFSSDNIVGMHNKGSRKADLMLEKVRYTQAADGRVIFATGTPITNSLADLYVLQYYLQPEELKFCNIYHFNEWISTFCQREHSFEIDVDSKNCKFTTRFSHFHNLPELMSMFSEICDFYQAARGELDLPDFAGYTDISVKRSEEQKKYIDHLAKRTEDIRARRVDPKDDNLLKVTVNGRMAALDIRLVEPELVGEAANDVQAEAGQVPQPKVPACKVAVCAGKMAELYFKNPGTCQLAFSDLSTPKEGFHIYMELKKNLIACGVKASEIAFIHDAVTDGQRTKMEKAFNEGKIRILIGSTAKLGTGTNVQERLLAIHHIDVPWRPADMIQREGRLIRQGNTCPEVYIYRYITTGSFDAYTYQLLENKQKFISQFMSGTLSALHREETDCADTVLSYAEIKALAIGNPMIKERVELSNQLEHARINQRAKRKELAQLTELLEHMPEQMEKERSRLRLTQDDLKYYRKHKEVIPREERQSFGEELLEALRANDRIEKDRLFDQYQGFDVLLPAHMDPEKPYVLLTRTRGGSYRVSMEDAKAMGCCQKLDHQLEDLSKAVSRHLDQLHDLQAQKIQAAADLETGNPYDRRVEEMADRLREIDYKLQEGLAA